MSDGPVVVDPSRDHALLKRREALVARSQALRRELTLNMRALRKPLDWADYTNRGWQWAASHPGLIVGGVATVLVLRPVRALRWAGRLVQAAQLWRRLQPLWAAVGPRMR